MSHRTTPITSIPGRGQQFNHPERGTGLRVRNARTAGSLTRSGPYAGTPAKNWLALRAYAPSGQVTLANLESLVSGAASHGGGWIPIVIQRGCSATLDQANYSTCTSSAGWVQPGRSADLHSWVQNAGQANGAPAGTTFQAMGATAKSAAPSRPPPPSPATGHRASRPPTADGQRDPVRDRPGFGGGQTHSPPTQHSHPVQPGLHRAVPADLLRHGPVPLLDNAGTPRRCTPRRSRCSRTLDTTPPTTTISCNGATCQSGAYDAPVTVTLTATDNPGGFGVDKTYYTTDGPRRPRPAPCTPGLSPSTGRPRSSSSPPISRATPSR